jgi:Short C-terminal domain
MCFAVAGLRAAPGGDTAPTWLNFEGVTVPSVRFIDSLRRNLVRKEARSSSPRPERALGWKRLSEFAEVSDMRLRDMFTSTVFLAVVVVHFGIQWYGWKVHIGEIQPAGDLIGTSGDSLWQVFSFPLFVLSPRRMQYLYFIQMLVANSALWGMVLAWSTYGALGRPRRRKRRVHKLTLPPKPWAEDPARTGIDRLLDLKRLLDQGLISSEEYQRKRASILGQV